MKSALRFFLIFLIVTIFISQSSALNCFTSKGEYGKCVKIHTCPKMIEILKNGFVSREDKIYLRKSRCYIPRQKPSDVFICCPQYPPKFTPDFNPRNHPLIPADCGRQIDYRIFGGDQTYIGEFPWMALLEYETRFGIETACSGAVISKRYILTAAHCLTGISDNRNLVSVRLGEHNTTQDPDCLKFLGSVFCADPVLSISIEETIAHKNYDRFTREINNDIGLLRLAEDIIFTKFIQPICLPENSKMRQSLVSSGWGKTENEISSDVKLKLTIPLKKNEKCNSEFNITLKFGQFCAGGLRRRSTCHGDSGGPVMIRSSGNSKSRWVSVGIVSVGPFGCGKENVPHIYTKVHDFLPWILSNLKQ